MVLQTSPLGLAQTEWNAKTMKPLPAELDAKIDEIKSWLFDGDQQKIAKRAQKTEQTVSRALNKKHFSPIVIEVAAEVMNENKRLFEIR